MRRLALPLTLALFAANALQGARADDAGVEFFEKKIRPVLVEQCLRCHSSGAKKIGGGLLLDHREGIREGGESGPAIEPGNPGDSLLVKAIRHEDDALKMPPKEKLPAAVVADFESWIRQGAPDPRDKASLAKAAGSWQETMRKRAQWWSFQPVRKPLVPDAKNDGGADDPIDGFLRAKLKQAGLELARPADPRTFARRLSLVLTGLPPTADQMNGFVRDCASTTSDPSRVAPEAAARLVDALLASPQFGERWARHWLDVVHFSETHGNEWNYDVHHAWRYRDYLIRAFNEDVPYDDFVREQIAGDLLPRPRWNAREGWNESVIGTGFYRFGEVNHDDCISLRQIGYDLADNQVDTLTKAFQATTVACARCHDHKLDAISMHDYYALLGVLRSSRQVSHSIDGPAVNAKPIAELHEIKRSLRKELAAVWIEEIRRAPEYMAAARAKRAKDADALKRSEGLDPKRLEKWEALLAAKSVAIEDPMGAWQALAASAASPPQFADDWRKWSGRVVKEMQSRAESNQKNYTVFADFRTDSTTDWQVGGQGLREAPGRSGDFVVQTDGKELVRAILPAGRMTNALSDKLNGTLRSPVLPVGKKQISFQVVGQRSSAVRLVSNNCQLNYKNYRALTFNEWSWVTFSPPDDRDVLRTYAELMTMFDNPKFPDQLSALGGDNENYRLPWEKAAENPRSYFGVTRVVLHDTPGPPQDELTHLRRLTDAKEPATPGALHDQYAASFEAAIRAWGSDQASDDDVVWLNALLRHGLISNATQTTRRCDELAAEYRRVEGTLAVPRVVAGMGDGGPGFAQTVFARGDCFRPGDAVPRRFLEALSPSLQPFTNTGSGRLELAERIADPKNPLTARVMVNRVWHHLFGTGLVRTVDDFGHVGETPSHPELLDYLAARFVEEGWSIKRLIRSIVLTEAFAASSQATDAGKAIDPQNRLLHHYPARRMEAEAVRDSMLAVSGRLDRGLYGLSVQPHRDQAYPDRRLFPGPLDGNGRRSLYIKNTLMEAPKFLAAFNLPGGKVTQGRRDVTNVPAQALAMLNDPFVLQQADVWAERLVERKEDSVESRVAVMFATGLNRPPTVQESERMVQAVQALGELHGAKGQDILASRAVWKDVAHAIFNMSEFLYIP